MAEPDQGNFPIHDALGRKIQRGQAWYEAREKNHAAREQQRKERENLWREVCEKIQPRGGVVFSADLVRIELERKEEFRKLLEARAIEKQKQAREQRKKLAHERLLKVREQKKEYMRKKREKIEADRRKRRHDAYEKRKGKTQVAPADSDG